ncbi:MAG: hypothetical protein AAFR51_17350 [Pseudomonadota bacterium]
MTIETVGEANESDTAYSTRPLLIQRLSDPRARKTLMRSMARKSLGYRGYRELRHRNWTFLGLSLVALGAISDLTTVLGPVVNIGLWVALAIAIASAVVVLGRFKYCHKFVLPLFLAIGMTFVFAGFNFAQARVPQGTEKGSLFSMLSRVDRVTQETNTIVTETQDEVAKMKTAQTDLQQSLEAGFQRLETQSLLQYTELLNAISEEKGVSKSALISHLLKLGASEDIDTTEIPVFLERFADEYLLVKERLLSLDIEDEELLKIRRRAAEALEIGDLEGARSLLSNARAVIQGGRETSARKEAILWSDEASIDELNLDYDEATSKYLEAASLVGFAPTLRAGYLTSAGWSIYKSPKERDLERAKALFLEANPFVSLDEDSRIWTNNFIGLGNVIHDLNYTHTDPVSLSEAERYYTQVLAVDGARIPGHVRGEAFLGIGNVYRRMASTAVDSQKYLEAIEKYEAGLKVVDPITERSTWHALRLNIADVYTKIGIRTADKSYMDAAARLFEDSIKAYNPKTEFSRWRQSNTSYLGFLRHAGDQYAENSVDYYHKGLAVADELLKDPRISDESGFAISIRYTQAVLYERLALLKSDMGYLQRSIEIYTKNIDLLDGPDDRIDWANHQFGLAIALSRFSKSNQTKTRLNRAIKALEASFEVYSQTERPHESSGALKHLAINKMSLGEMTSDPGLLREAIDLLGASMEILSEHINDEDRVDRLYNQGLAYWSLAELTSNTDDELNAISKWSSALEIVNEQKDPHSWAELNRLLGEAYFESVIVTDDHSERSKSIMHLSNALEGSKALGLNKARRSLTMYQLRILLQSNGVLNEQTTRPDFAQLNIDLAELISELFQGKTDNGALKQLATNYNQSCWHTALAIESDPETSVNLYTRARAHCDSAMQNYKMAGDSRGYIASAHSAGYIDLVKGEFDSDKSSLNASIELFFDLLQHKDISEYSDLEEEVRRDLSRAESSYAEVD